MKLTIPETWETQISAHGNKPDVWESLIGNTFSFSIIIFFCIYKGISKRKDTPQTRRKEKFW